MSSNFQVSKYSSKVLPASHSTPSRAYGASSAVDALATNVANVSFNSPTAPNRVTANNSFNSPAAQNRITTTANNSFNSPAAQNRITTTANNSYNSPAAQNRITTTANNSFNSPADQNRITTTANNSFNSPAAQNRITTTANNSYNSPATSTAPAKEKENTPLRQPQAAANASPATPSASSPYPLFQSAARGHQDTPIPFTRLPAPPSPMTPPYLQNFPYQNTLSPMSPCQPAYGTTLPPSYTRHRQEMESIKIAYQTFNNVLGRFGCDKQHMFSEWLFNNLPGIRFERGEELYITFMSEKLNQINQEVEQSHKPIQNLMRCYQLYENLVKKAYGYNQAKPLEALRKIEEVEQHLFLLESQVNHQILNLHASFRVFIFTFTSRLSKTKIQNENSAYQVFQQEKLKQRPSMPLTFAGMGYEYKQLLNQTREFRGTAWLNDLLHVFLESYYLTHYKRPFNGERVSVQVSGLSQWIIDVEKNLALYPENVQNAIYGMKERVGCWEQYNSIKAVNRGQALEVYLNFHHHLQGSINYPFKEVDLTKGMINHLKELNQPNGLRDWLSKAEWQFSNVTGWRKNADIAVKEKALLIYCFDFEFPNELFKERVINQAKQIVKYMYSVELTQNMQ
jgi:hypothetical protein